MHFSTIISTAASLGFLVSCAAAEPLKPNPVRAEASSGFDQLRGGGNVLVMRHGDSPHDQAAPLGMTADCRLGEGRGLSARGFSESRAMGALLAKEGVPIAKTYTSRMCRSWDTAALVAAGSNVEPSDYQMTTDPEKIAAFKKQIEAELADNPGANILLVSHSNIAPLYGAYAADNEEEVPSGYAYLVSPDDWQASARIFVGQVDHTQKVTVEITE